MSTSDKELNYRDHALHVEGDPPPGYPPVEVPDTWREASEGTFDTRRRAYLAFCARNPAPRNFKAPWYELPRMAAGKPVHEGVLIAACDFVDARRDCADFVLHSLLRQRYQFPEAPLSARLNERIRRSILGFKYWPDEPGVDSLCTWTENHQILYASAALLAGQLHPTDVFTNSGRPGSEMVRIHAPRIRRWLDLRFRTGFSEWLSNVYYDEDLTALLSLVDFCRDDGIRRRAFIVVDVLLLDCALHTFKGVFVSTHGRSYEGTRTDPLREGMADTTKLLFGTGCWSRADNMSAVALALSPAFQLSPAIESVALDSTRSEVTVRQRMGIRLDEARRWGLGFRSFEDGMVFLSLEAYLHRRTANLTLRMFDAFRWWENEYFAPFRRNRRLVNFARRLGLLPLVARALQKDLCRNTREEVNIVTCRTPDYQLSSAVDYRKGFGGDQQAIWQATLGPGAVCFVTHPAKKGGDSPDYWTGEGTLPRVGQHRNVLVSVYRIDTRPGLYHTNRLIFTHAWLPRDSFDEVSFEEGWVFARKGDGFLSLWARNGFDQILEEEVTSPGRENVWVCEMGRRSTHGSFPQFIRAIQGAELRTHDLDVSYRSPSIGLVQFGWRGPLTVDGVEILLRGYPRYESPWVEAPFDPREIIVEHGGHRLVLNWVNAERKST